MTRSIIRTATIAIAIAALAAPTALARTDTPSSLALKAAAKQEQDARSPGARVGMLACSPGALTVQAAGVCGSPRASSQVWATSAGVR